MPSRRIRPANPAVKHPPKVVAAPTVKAAGADAEVRVGVKEEDVAVGGAVVCFSVLTPTETANSTAMRFPSGCGAG